MTIKKVEITKHQTDRLMGDLGAIPPQPIGNHLTDDEFVEYSMSALNEQDNARVEAHMSSCDECAAQMERLFEVAQKWSGTGGGQRVAALSKQIVANASATAKQPVGPTPAFRAACAAFSGGGAGLALAAGTSSSHHTPDCDVVGSIDAHGNLVIRVSSFDQSNAGVKIRVKPFGKTFHLEQVAPDQVGGEVQISAAEREKFPAAIPVEVEALV
jgi:hypothetical protein